MCRSAAQFGRFMSDIQKALPVIIVCGAGVSFILGFVWLIFVKTCTGVLVWITVWLALVAAIIVTIVSYFRAGILTKELVASAVRHLVAQICVLVLGLMCTFPHLHPRAGKQLQRGHQRKRDRVSAVPGHAGIHQPEEAVVLLCVCHDRLHRHSVCRRVVDA